MIDKKPVYGDLTGGWMMGPYSGENAPAPTLTESIPSRPTEVLGPNGEKVHVAIPRRAVGFDLRPKKST
jgi:hypothetical protein